MFTGNFKKNNKNQKGSALVFSLIILVNAVLIVGAVVFVSIVQRKTTGKVRHTSTAIQEADSGIEEILKKVNVEDVEDDPISSLCDSFSAGRCALDETDAEIYFFDEDDNLLTSGQVQDIMYAKSVGEAGYAQDRVTRAFKVGVGEVFVCGLDKLEDEYKTIAVGENCWMADNLNADVAGRLCYNGDCEEDRRGGLYPWSVTMDGDSTEGSRGICPEGWHIPTDEEWNDLEDAYSTGFCSDTRTGWGCAPAGDEDHLQDNTVGGFNAKLGGYHNGSSFSELDFQGYYWTSSDLGGNAVYRKLKLNNSQVFREEDMNKGSALSVRCVKDID
ncbi:MAG: FISUMP domain-containing protein [Candidatus Moraniibacteriota bacterium]